MAVHRANHPRTRHLVADVWEVKPREATGGRPVDLLWASPDCTHFSVAKGDVPKRQEIRSLAWAVVRWAAAVRPRVICLENVSEFQGWGPLGDDGRPVKRRMGATFLRWRGKLIKLGYEVDFRVLDASHYGAPTRRKRLFLVARCDGQPIRWPEPTHGPGRLPFRTAAECIDWSLPCPSIFGRKKALAEKTLWRIAQGIRRFVLESPAPFIVRTDHHQSHATNAFPLDAPLGTITSAAGHAVVAPTLIQTGYGEREGQAARVPGLHKPLGTMVNGQKHALVAAFLARHFGGVVGAELPEPLHTVTARDHHSLAAATLLKLRGDCHGAAVDEPAPTITAAGTHVAEVRAFLTAFYGSDGSVGKGQSLHEPARTLTARHRLGLVTVAGADYQIVDIGMRMLEPHELLRAQFGRFAEDYDLSAAVGKKGAYAKGAAVRLIGNSVCPEVAEALVRANLPGSAEEVAA
jgi:DNA (cytosine-5)-methyltransferase 1